MCCYTFLSSSMGGVPIPLIVISVRWIKDWHFLLGRVEGDSENVN